MILIADSGSSKTDWRLLHEDGSIAQAQSIGFNPFYQNQQQFDTEIQEVLMPQLSGEVKEIYYYGAGCSTDANRKVIREVLEKHFSDTHIEVWHDLLAAARALCGHQPGFACIIGTGINTCFYDGEHIVENVASLGYVLGDEGSGAHLGKQLVADYLRKDLPRPIWDSFMKRYGIDRDHILEKVYQGTMPGRFLASFSKFLFDNIQEPYCYGLVYNSFNLFIEKNLKKYANLSAHQVHFTGSVAFYFNNILRKACQENNVSVGNIVESPIAGLTLFHQNSLTK